MPTAPAVSARPPADAWSLFGPGDRVCLAGAGGEPRGALAALAADPELGRGLRFTGAWLPGVNDFDPSEGVPDASASVVFVNPALRAGFEAKRVEFLSLNYWHLDRWLSGPAGLTGAIMQVSPPQDGFVSTPRLPPQSERGGGRSAARQLCCATTAKQVTCNPGN